MKMKFRLKTLMVIAIISPCTLTYGQAGRSKKTIQKEDAVIYKNLQSYIAVLASDSLEGRRAGTPGEMKAVNYIVSQYQKLGIPAAAKDYSVAFEIDEGKLMGPSTKVTVNDVDLEKNSDFFP